jgi:hypothetical protein
MTTTAAATNVVIEPASTGVGAKADAGAGGGHPDGGSTASDRASEEVALAPHAPWINRVFAPQDTFGPKVRMGVVWFGLELGALYLGRFALGPLFGLVAGVAALQTAREWRRAGWQPSRLVAGVSALAIPVAASLGAALVGAVVLAVPLAALVAAALRTKRRRRTPWLGAAGTTVRCGLFAGLAGAMPVLVYRTSAAAALVLVVLVSAYEMGDFLNGSDAYGIFAGPSAGMICAVVVAFAVGVVVELFQIDPFQAATHAWVFGLLVVVLCPLSQLVASLLLPRADARAPALRRLDSYLLTGPAWLWLLWSFIL